MVTMRFNVQTTGPLFVKRPSAAVTRRLGMVFQTLVEEGEQRLDQVLRPRPAGVYLSVNEAGKGQASQGHYRRSVNGTASPMGGVIHDGGVIYGPWLEGDSPRNMTTRFKGYHAFRQTGQWLEKERTGTVLKRHIEALIEELS